jgi:hypothetical protein
MPEQDVVSDNRVYFFETMTRDYLDAGFRPAPLVTLTLFIVI